jgi:spore coat protein U-like protein
MKTLGKILATVGLASAVSGAFGATATTTFTVTANVTGACTVSATNLAFGTYPVASAANIDATSTITVNCPNLLPYTVSVPTPTARAMTGPLPATPLNYALYSDLARTTAFSNSGAGTGANQNITVYGRIPSGQNPTQGSYTDTVTVTVTY